MNLLLLPRFDPLNLVRSIANKWVIDALLQSTEGKILACVTSDLNCDIDREMFLDALDESRIIDVAPMINLNNLAKGLVDSYSLMSRIKVFVEEGIDKLFYFRGDHRPFYLLRQRRLGLEPLAKGPHSFVAIESIDSLFSSGLARNRLETDPLNELQIGVAEEYSWRHADHHLSNLFEIDQNVASEAMRNSAGLLLPFGHTMHRSLFERATFELNRKFGIDLAYDHFEVELVSAKSLARSRNRHDATDEGATLLDEAVSNIFSRDLDLSCASSVVTSCEGEVISDSLGSENVFQRGLCFARVSGGEVSFTAFEDPESLADSIAYGDMTYPVKVAKSFVHDETMKQLKLLEVNGKRSRRGARCRLERDDNQVNTSGPDPAHLHLDSPFNQGGSRCASVAELVDWSKRDGASCEGAPVVTVAIAHRNDSVRLKRLIASLAMQTYTSFEVVVVDDGSNPSELTATLDISNGSWPFAITVISSRHIYKGAARNLAVSKSKGSYICFMDSDNYALPNQLEVLVRALEFSGVDMVSSSFVFEDQSNSDIQRHLLDRQTVAFPPPTLALGVSNNCYGDTCSIMKRSVFDYVGGFRQEFGRRLEDWDLFHRIMAAGFEIESVPLPLFVYRVNVDKGSNYQEEMIKASIDRMSVLINSKYLTATDLRALVECEVNPLLLLSKNNYGSWYRTSDSWRL